MLNKALEERSFGSPVEWAIFAMVANRALAPDSKRGVEEWVGEEVALGNHELISLQHLCRAMDFLLAQDAELRKEVFFVTAGLLNLEVDLLFFDTATTYVECEEEDDFRRYGHSKDSRPDRPQVVIGLAVTKEGLPVRCWVLPGNTQDMTTVEMIKTDLRGWRLGRCVWVMDRGMSSEENRVVLQRAGGLTSWARSSATAKRPIRKRCRTKDVTRKSARTWRSRRSSSAKENGAGGSSWFLIPSRPRKIRRRGTRL